MSSLALDQYVVHGGDWGSIIATCMAQIDGGNHILGIHTTLLWHPYSIIRRTHTTHTRTHARTHAGTLTHTLTHTHRRGIL